MKSVRILLWIAATAALTFASSAQGFNANGLPAPVAVGATGNIYFIGDEIAIDSYNSHDTNFSTNGEYDPSKTSANGNVASVNGMVYLGSDTIEGSLYLGPNATYTDNGTVTGNTYYNFNVQFPDVVLPSGAGSWPTAAPVTIITYTTNITMKHGVITTVITTNTSSPFYDFTNSGNYILPNDTYPIYVEAGVTVNLNVTSPTFAPTDLEIQGGITNSGTAKLYFNGPTSISIAGNTAIDASNRPENLWYFGLPSLTSLIFSSSSSFVGVIYAPEANCIINGGGNNHGISGSMIVNNLTVDSHYNFHFDESLAISNAWIVSQPTNQAVPLGSNATFTVSAIGNAPLWYSWYQEGTNLNWIQLASGTNNSTLTLTNVQISDIGFYAVVVSNAFNSVASSIATLNVIVPPAITAQPTNQLVFPGTEVTFGASVTASRYFFQCQWLLNGTNLPNATNFTCSIPSATTNDAGLYSLLATNPAGMAVSSNASLTVVFSPDSQTNYAGTTATFTVQTFGPESLNYQWQMNGTNLVDGGNISGSDSNQLTITNVSDADAASYSVMVSDATTGVTTPNATLTVIDPPTVSLQFLNGSPVLDVSGMLSNNFVLQYNTDLTTTNWIDLISISNLTSSPYQFVDPDGIDQPARFYRVIMQ